MKTKSDNWSIQVSKFATNTLNPIRSIVENLNVKPNKDKEMISLSIGDPTVYGNLAASNVIKKALIDVINSGKYDGYMASNGLEDARQAIADYASVEGAMLNKDDIFITSGCSHALDLCICLLGEAGKNVLIPRPGFPLYQTLCSGYGIETRYYDLQPEKEWQIDFDHMELTIDHNTVAIIYNNPSNPCGSVASEEQQRKLLEIAERYQVPIIADEIYEDIVFGQQPFIPIASLSSQVPVFSCRGTTKKFLIPGYRLGWIQVHDRHDRFGETVRSGLQKLCQRLMGANSLVQAALPVILRDTPRPSIDNMITIIKNNAELAYNALSKVNGLRPVKPNGSMYMMIEIDTKRFPAFSTDMDVVEALVAEQSVLCLPGRCFDYANFVRIVLTLPEEMMKKALKRIEEFCCTHYVAPNPLENSCKISCNGFVDQIMKVDDGKKLSRKDCVHHHQERSTSYEVYNIDDEDLLLMNGFLSKNMIQYIDLQE